ncbi:MAG: hypothetical protein ACE5IR_14175, partial [bacterium]
MKPTKKHQKELEEIDISDSLVDMLLEKHADDISENEGTQFENECAEPPASEMQQEPQLFPEEASNDDIEPEQSSAPKSEISESAKAPEQQPDVLP